MLLVISLLPVLVSCFLPSQEPLLGHKYVVNTPFDDKFEELVRDMMHHWHVPGLSVAVVKANNTFAKGFGTAVFPSTKATADTLYYVGSTTKSFTAASILLLIEDTVNTSSSLSLATPVSSLIREEFVLPDPYATEKATLEDLLSHRTGMPRHDMSYGGSRQPTLREIVENLRHLPMTADLRTSWQYCNMMFSTLSYIIEKLSAMPLGAFFRKRIWKPIGMDNTFISITDARNYANASLSAGYYWNKTSASFIAEPYLDDPVIAGAGAIISSVLDYSRYLRAMLTQHAFLSPTSHAELRASRMISMATDYAPYTSPALYGLAWQQQTYRSVEIFSHSGSVTGYGALMAYAPAIDWGVAIMANTEVTSNWIANLLFFALLDDVLDTPVEDRFDWKDYHNGKAAEAEKKRKNARSILYPDAPKKDQDKRPLALPLEQHLGTYGNRGYGNITITLDSSHPASPFAATDEIEAESEPHLHATVYDRTWRYAICFEHISGEYFLAWIGPTDDWPNSLFDEQMPMKVEFTVGVDGAVQGAGIQYESMGGLLWFAKLT